MCCKERYHITFNPIQTGLFWLLLPVTGWNNILVTSILLKQWRNLMPSLLSYPMNPYALRTCAVGASCHVLTDLKLNIVRVSIYNFLVHYKLQIPGTLQLHHIVQLSGKIQIPLKVAVRRKKETLKN